MPRLPALPIIRGGITEGLSANATYRQYRAAAAAEGLETLRRQDFLRLYSQTVGLRGQAAAAASAPKNVPHGGLTPQKRDTLRARGFGYWVGMYQRTRGGADFQMKPWLVKSFTPLTPEEVESRAGEAWAAGERDYDFVILGIGFLGVEEFNPRGY